MENVVLTIHGFERLNQRCDAERIEVGRALAERAWRNGKTPDCFPKRMRNYLIDIQNRECPGITVKVHSKNCYIFTEYGKLITVYSIAHNYDRYMNTLKPFDNGDYRYIA